MARKLNGIFCLCCIILIALLLSTVFFLTNTNKTTIAFVESLTSSIVSTQVSQFDLNLENQIRILKAIGEGFPQDLDINDIHETSRQLERFGYLYNIDSLYLIRKDGTGITYNDQTSYLQFSDTYSLFTSGKTISTGIEVPSGKDESHFYVAIPIKENNEVKYLLKAYYCHQTIKNILLFPFIENVRIGLVSENGMTVSDSFIQISDPTLLHTLNSMDPGVIRFYLKNGDYFIYHSPTSATGVYFYIEIPITSINTITLDLTKAGILFGILVLLLCIILMYFLLKSERKQRKNILKLTDKLKQSEARYQNAFNYKDNIAWEYNPVTKEFSAVIKRKEGRTQEIKISNALETIIKNRIVHPDYIEEFKNFASQIYADPPYTTCILKLRHTSGDYYWARLSFIISSDESQKQTILGLIEDISDIKDVQDKYDQEKQTIEAMTDNYVCYYLINLTSGTVLDKKSRDISPDVLDNIKNMEELVLNEISYIHDKEDIARLKEICTIKYIHELLDNDEAFADVEYKRRSPSSGVIEWISLSVKPMKTPNNEIVMAIQLIDIDNRKKQEMLLQRRAERDLLTDLYNKMTISSLINDYLKLPRKEDQIDVLIMLDADNYKSVNDTFGHVFGDKVLIDIADSLKACVKQNDLVGRIGGDEFMIFLKNVRKKDDVKSILERIVDGIHHTYAENDAEVTISASIGVAYVTPEISSFQTLYKLVDKALYKAKESGKNCYRFAKDDE